MSGNKGNLLKLYKASAGSGKTYTLVREFLILSLSSSSSAYKEILAVTFTNKAANEMKSKILNNLKGIIDNSEKYLSMKNDLLKTMKIDEETLVLRSKNLYDNIIHNYSDFNVSTIDSFVQQLSRSFAKELNLPAQYKVMLDEDELLDDMIQRIDAKIGKEDLFLTRILSCFIEYKLNEENTWRIDSPIRNFVKKLLKENAYNKGESLEVRLLDQNQYQEIESYLNEKIKFYTDNIYNNIQKINDFNKQNKIEYDCYNNVLPSLLKKIEKNFDTEVKDLVNKTIKGIFSGEKKWYKGKSAPDGISELQSRELIDYFVKIVENYKSLYLIRNVKGSLYLYVLRGALLDIVNQYIEETNNVHISEFNKRISDVLDDCTVPFIYERIGHRFKHYFIDEFQDTSVLQWFNFLPLINNSLSEHRMNLLVGDAKQAIYRFRSGEVEQIINLPKIYKNPNNDFTMECERNFIENISEKVLDVNYRSLKNIIKFNNSFFTIAKNQLGNNDYCLVYENNMKQKFRDNLEYEGYVNVEIFEMDNFVEEGKSRPDEGLYKASLMSSMADDIVSLKNKGFDYNDITILVRSNSEGSEIAEYLSKRNIQVISSDSILLKSSDKVQLIVMTLKYLADNDKVVAKFLLIAYQRLCEVGNVERFDVQSVVMSDFDGDELLLLRNKAFTLYDLCARLLKMYGFDMVDDVFVQYFMNLVYEWQNREDGGINDFIEYWDRKSDSFFVKVSGEIDAVQIMTIHKSKGLEFKVVMYPYAPTRIPERFHGGETWLSFKNDFHLLEDMPYLDNFILPLNKSLLETDMENYYYEEFDKIAFDDLNVMYVAMTRPKDILYVYTNDNKTKENPDNFFVNYFEQNNELDFVSDKKDCSSVFRFGELKKQIDDDDPKDNNVLSLNENIEYETVDWTESLEFESDPTMFWTGDKLLLSQEWGTLVHEILSKINTIDEASKILGFYVNDGTIDDEVAEILLNRFYMMVEKQEVREAFSENAVVRNEMDILTSDGSVIRPDRYVELPDKVIVVDYKTGNHNKKYYDQLRCYMLTLQNMGIRKKIEGFLLYVGEKIEVEQVFLDR